MNQSWISIGRTNDEAETPILWPPDEKGWLIWKDPVAGKDWGQEEKGMTKEEIVGWLHRLSGHEFHRLQELMLDREAWRAAAHGVANSWKQLSDSTELKWTECLPSTVWNRNPFLAPKMSPSFLSRDVMPTGYTVLSLCAICIENNAPTHYISCHTTCP